MKAFLFFSVFVLIRGSYATLLLIGPPEPVLEGETFILECLFTDSELNISLVHFETYSKYTKGWRPILERSWCYYSLQIKWMADSLVLTVPRAGTFYEGSYRCASDAHNSTASDNVSNELAIKVHYMTDPLLYRQGYTSYLGVPRSLQVRDGDDVVLDCSVSSSEDPIYSWSKNGDDWIKPSSELKLKKVSEMDGGWYTCMVEHPVVKSLTKSRTINLTVLPADASWYETSNGRLVLMTSAVGVSLLLFILFMSIFLCRRAKQTRTSKGPIDDRSQKKPIYKSSAESLPSTCGDQQPLV